eukprot:15011646-Alexandrium_andersonii.AAC.1
MVFLDWEKAFDSVDRAKMLMDFRNNGLGPQNCGVLEALLESPVLRVRMNQETTGWMPQERG